MDGTVRVLVRNLPVADSYGNKYTYSVTETEADGTDLTGTGHSLQKEISPFVESPGLVTGKQTQERLFSKLMTTTGLSLTKKAERLSMHSYLQW